MNKPSAEAVKDLSLKAITELSRIVRLTRDQCSSRDEFEAVARAVGTVIGLIETDILGTIYRDYPDLDDLA